MTDMIQVRVKPGFHYNPDSGGNYKPGTILEIPVSDYWVGHAQLVAVGSDEEEQFYPDKTRAQKGGARRGLKKKAQSK